jgi:hypothetical protein
MTQGPLTTSDLITLAAALIANDLYVAIGHHLHQKAHRQRCSSSKVAHRATWAFLIALEARQR